MNVCTEEKLNINSLFYAFVTYGMHYKGVLERTAKKGLKNTVERIRAFSTRMTLNANRSDSLSLQLAHLSVLVKHAT